MLCVQLFGVRTARDNVNIIEQSDIPTERNVKMNQNQNPLAVTALVDGLYEKLSGGPPSMAVKLITGELIGGRPADYAISKTPESVRLGVLRYFALLVAHSQEKGLGIIVTKDENTSENYALDRYGENKISAADYLGMVGMTVLFSRDIPTSGSEHLFPDIGLIVTGAENAQYLLRFSAEIHRRLVYPLIEDDGKIARIIPGSRGNWDYVPFR